MYPIDAKTATFEVVEIVGIPGLYAPGQVDRSTVPKGMYLYELQSDTEDWSQPHLVGEYISEDRFGAVLTASPIQMSHTGCLGLKPGDFVQNARPERLTVTQFEDRCFGRAAPAPARHFHRARHSRKGHAAPVR